MSSALVRSDAIKRLGIKTDLNTPEIELFARLAAEGARFDHEPGYLAEFRTHAESSTASGLFSGTAGALPRANRRAGSGRRNETRIHGALSRGAPSIVCCAQVNRRGRWR